MPFFSAANRGERAAMDAKRRAKLIRSYAPDWHVLPASAVFFGIDGVQGYRREFSLSDTSLRHPYAVHERIPNVALYMIAGVSPFLLQIVVNLITIRSWWDFHNATLGLILSLSITGAFTQFTKLTVGRPRPDTDLIDRCQPPPGSQDPVFGLSNSSICTQTDAYMMKDGFRSFPSGHSSLSFAGLGFLAFYLAGKMHLFDKRGHAGKAWLSVAPLAAASMVAISRSMDYRHHWHDILVGSILGLTMAYFCYRQYYPSLGDELSHRPYSPRIKREEPILPTHGRTESVSLSMLPGEETSGGVKTNDFMGASEARYRDSSSDHDHEAEGTVPRPNPGSLPEIWKEGEDGQ
ncbi:hypothetical protein JAAARDRAFT_125403 [Jaapia argillacea MUCL 33604]|uniref:Phosphatidic acid phosphatase type 2/haloperoxidase domain-containing protein n=1 Tax=Jaapia argillacea MUCL 33604 TaxID=933084 RepID=A0A067Q3N1_9AGAM|nr:hypothetical protein JAAARDRAFT_125403 [Jaapia argillacea MUCL 33604]